MASSGEVTGKFAFCRVMANNHTAVDALLLLLLRMRASSATTRNAVEIGCL